jgi:hypothetical protein
MVAAQCRQMKNRAFAQSGEILAGGAQDRLRRRTISTTQRL